MQLAFGQSQSRGAAAMRRGACPALGSPMPTGDGLLVRFRPLDGALSLAALGAVVAAARRFGNGRMEITARGSLQLRGIRPGAVPDLEAAIRDAVEVPEGVPVETSPLAGLDPREHADPRPLAAALRQAIATAELSALSPKVTVVVDGGGAIPLDHLRADIRLRAEADGWRLDFGDRPTGRVSAGEAVGRTIALLHRIAAAGPAARARDLTGGTPPASAPGPVAVGSHRLADGKLALGLAPAFGAIAATDLMALGREAGRAGATGVRLAPGHALLLTGLDAAAAPALAAIAQPLGFVADPCDPRLAVAACPGSKGCASGTIASRTLAAAIASAAPRLLDGSLSLHVSGCAKGCAHPAAAALTLVGDPDGNCRLVVDGRATDAGLARVAPKHAGIGFARLERLYREGRHAQESASEWLARIGPERIAAVFG